tara:strand:- start:312 stop:653 length:342 start_codon:yes stop_codon:yes gene_type:complete
MSNEKEVITTLALFVNEGREQNPKAPPYNNKKFTPEQDIVFKAGTTYEITLWKNFTNSKGEKIKDNNGNESHYLSIPIVVSEYWENKKAEVTAEPVEETETVTTPKNRDDIPF